MCEIKGENRKGQMKCPAKCQTECHSKRSSWLPNIVKQKGQTNHHTKRTRLSKGQADCYTVNKKGGQADRLWTAHVQYSFSDFNFCDLSYLSIVRHN